MTEAKLAPNLPGWMVEHANRYLSSGGTVGHIYKMTQPGRPEMTVPSLLLTTTGRKSGERFIFPLFYGKAGDSYFVVASKGGAPQHPGWYRNILANPDVDVQVGTARMKARARTATGEERALLWEKALEFWPAYADYQRKTEREIPVVVLDSARRHQRHRPRLAAAREGHSTLSLSKPADKDDCADMAVTMCRLRRISGRVSDAGRVQAIDPV
jgi:deazaflavin-dependent oxidoreductase (nitroreductase family)